MNMRLSKTLLAATLALTPLCIQPSPDPDPTPVAARFIRARVSWQGQVLLRGSTSDNGKPDADAVWRYLPNLSFEPTDDFTKMLESEEDDSITLRTEPKTRDVEVEIAYGGRVKLWGLTVKRSAADPKRWTLDPKVLADFADLRWIERSWARRLTKR